MFISGVFKLNPLSVSSLSLTVLLGEQLSRLVSFEVWPPIALLNFNYLVVSFQELIVIC